MPDHLAASPEAVAARPPLAVWLQACRVRSLAISSVAVLVGGGVALAERHWSGRLVLAWLGAVALQAGTNLTNVYHNYKATRAGTFDPRGSSAVIRAGLLPADAVRRAGLACFAAGVACGAVLAALAGWPILAVGIPGLLAGYFYAAPPVRLAYAALGVVTVFLCMGPAMVVGSYYAVTLHASAGAAAASVPVGLLAAAIMHTNDLRDHDTDVAFGKRTLATLLGPRGARGLLVAMLGAAYAGTIAAVALGALPWPVLLVGATAPHAVALGRAATRAASAAELNAAWSLGVRLFTEFGVAMVAGLGVAALLPR